MAIERKEVEHRYTIEYHKALLNQAKDSKATEDSADKPEIVTLD
jgi:hypothetical protein